MILKDTLFLRGLVASLITLSISLSSVSAEWVSLFNGQNLDGWHQLNGEAEYRVENGAIVGKSILNTPNSFLATNNTYGNFILEFEFKVDQGLNSGVQFRSLSKSDYNNGRVHGYQFEIDTSDRAWSAGIYDEARRGWLYPGAYNPKSAKLFKRGEWNKARIECVGTEIRTFLNGSPVSHLIDNATAKGFIALQVHSIHDDSLEGTEVRWRNIRIDTDPKSVTRDGNPIYIRNTIPNTLSEAQIAQGWTSLFDGKAIKGFVGKGIDSFPDQGWVVQDEALTILPTEKGKSGPGDIVTEKDFAAFEFEFEFRLTEGANSGVKYYVSEYEHKDTGHTSILGLEYQVLDDENHPDAKKGAAGNRTCASLYDLIPAYDRVHNRDVSASVGSWNLGRIVAHPDGTVEHWLNGFKVLEYQRGTNIYDALVARSKYKDHKNFGLAEKGELLLQDHSDEVSYRSLRVREL